MAIESFIVGVGLLVMIPAYSFLFGYGKKYGELQASKSFLKKKENIK